MPLRRSLKSYLGTKKEKWILRKCILGTGWGIKKMGVGSCGKKWGNTGIVGNFLLGYIMGMEHCISPKSSFRKVIS